MDRPSDRSSARTSVSLRVDGPLPTPRSSARASSRKESVQDEETLTISGQAQDFDMRQHSSGRLSPRKASFLDGEEQVLTADQSFAGAAESLLFDKLPSTGVSISPPSSLPLAPQDPFPQERQSLVRKVPSPPREPALSAVPNDHTLVQALQAGKKIVCFDPRLQRFVPRWLKVDLRRTFLYVLESNADVQGSVRALQEERPCIVRLDHVKCVHSGNEASEMLDEVGLERTEARFASYNAVVLHHLEPKSWGEPEVIWLGCKSTPETKMIAFLEAPGDLLEAHLSACLRHLPDTSVVFHNAATKLQNSWQDKRKRAFLIPRVCSSTLTEPGMLFNAAAESLDVEFVLKCELEGSEDMFHRVSVPAAMELGSGRTAACVLDSVLGRDLGLVDRATLALHMEELGTLREICRGLAEGNKCDLAKFLLYGSKDELAKAILRPTQDPDLVTVAEKAKQSLGLAKAQPLKRLFLSAVGHRFAQEEQLSQVTTRLRSLGKLPGMQPGRGRMPPRNPRPVEPVGIVSPRSDIVNADLVKRLGDAPVRGRRLRSVQYLESRAPSWVPAADGIVQLLMSAGVQRGQVLAIDAHGDADAALFSAHYCLEIPGQGPLSLRYKREEVEEGFSWPGLYEKLDKQLEKNNVISITGSTTTNRGRGGTLFAFHEKERSLAGGPLEVVESRGSTRQQAADRLLRLLEEQGVEAGQLLWVDLHQQPNTDDVCLSAHTRVSLPSMGRRPLRVDESPPNLGWAALYAWAAARIEALALSQEDVVSVTYSRDRAERCMGLLFHWEPELAIRQQSRGNATAQSVLQATEPTLTLTVANARPKAQPQPLSSLRGFQNLPAAKRSAGSNRWHWAWQDGDCEKAPPSPRKAVESTVTAAPCSAALSTATLSTAGQQLPLKVAAELDDFIVMPGKVIFRSSDAVHDMPAADLAACKRFCRAKRCGAFIVSNQRAYFRHEAPEECLKYLRDDPRSTTYVLRGSSSRPTQLHVVEPSEAYLVESDTTAEVDRACACKMQ